MPATPLRIMTTDQMEALITEAQECSEGECSVDDVGNLLDTLKSQQKDLNVKLDQIKKMIISLEGMNGKDMDRDEVRETVRAIMRIFSVPDRTYAGGLPSGYSGEVGTGSTTAYDALNPKPYKP